MKNMGLLGQIQMLVSELKRHTEVLESEGGVVHPIDAGLLRDKTRSLYDVVLQLNTGESYWPAGATVSNRDKNQPNDHQNKPAIETPDVQLNDRLAAPDFNPAQISAHESDEAPSNLGSFVGESNISFPEKEIKLEPNPPVKVTPKQRTEPQPTMLDLFGETPILADKLQISDNSLAKKIEHAKISDLREAIGINDKFLMINELFEGNIQYYNRAIDELNSFESYNGAKTYLIELSVQHRWESHGPALERIHSLIERRFANDN